MKQLNSCIYKYSYFKTGDNIMGKTITTHFLEGTPKGIQSVQISNKNIMGFVIPRAEIKKMQDIEELAGSPSLYFLLGENKDTSPKAYVGQTDDFLSRVIDHNQKKDFWNKALVFISQAGTLNKADVMYLEFLALQHAKDNGVYALNDNKQIPKEPRLQRHSKDTLNDFFADVAFITEFLNYPLFKSQESDAPVEYFYANSRGCQAKGFYDENGFTVLKGSIISKTEVPSFIWADKRHQLLKTLTNNSDGDWTLNKDHTFNSPSAAADFCIGRACNGWLEWKNTEGRTLDEIYRKEQ